MMAEADKTFGYGLDFVEIARIWKAGCIIRAVFLDEIMKVYKEEPNLPNLLVARRFRDAISQRQESWRRVVKTAVDNGIPTPSFSASLAYYDAYRRERLPANLVQAQRDYFGAHTYERTDKAGTFHTEWAQPQR
jgi:6-phosphogluconate dehydrogenase